MDMEKDDLHLQQGLVSVINKLILVIVVLVGSLVAIPVILYFRSLPSKPEVKVTAAEVKTSAVKAITDNYWKAPDINAITVASEKEKVEYGRELIVHTAKYLGPNGTVMKISNGMNCQNCHLNAGTAVFGNNYGSVASLYPKFRARSGSIENIYKRINDCFERSLNGKALDTSKKEMQSIAAYISFVGSNVKKGTKAEGSGLKDIAFLDRAADPLKGKELYSVKCQSCHQPHGEGLLNADQSEYTYPPLWGDHSFNDGAGLFRLSNFAKYIKNNMPQGVTHENPQLTDEEAWDIASYVNGQPRPHIKVTKDWPDISKKPFDHPFGPFDDAFTENQHKLGPFKPIIEEQKKKEVNKKQKS